MFDAIGVWPNWICAEALFVPEDINHLTYFSEHYPESIEVSDFIREDPGNNEATEILIDLAIRQINDHSNPGLQKIHISEMETLAEEHNLSRLMEAVKIAAEKWNPIFNELDEKERLRCEKEIGEAPVRRIIEARELVKNGATAWRARNLVRQLLKDEGFIGDEAREIAKAADAFD